MQPSRVGKGYVIVHVTLVAFSGYCDREIWQNKNCIHDNFYGRMDLFVELFSVAVLLDVYTSLGITHETNYLKHLNNFIRNLCFRLRITLFTGVDLTEETYAKQECGKAVAYFQHCLI